MDNAIVHAKKDGHKNENRLQSSNKSSESSKKDCSSHRLVRKIKPDHDILSSSVHFCIQKLFLRHIFDLNKKITNLEEKYVRHCLKLVHISASRAKKANYLPERFGSRFLSSSSGCDALLLFSTGAENFTISSSGGPVFGSNTGTRSMTNSPLICQFGSLDDDAKYTRTNALEIREPTSSAGVLPVGSSTGLQNERVVLEDQRFRSKQLHKRPVSFSITNSESSAYCRGTLQCSWNNGFPRYVFSTEDQRDVYKTNLSKVDQNSDYIYTFYRKDSYLVAKMSVSTSFTLCPHGTETMETQFVLRAADHNVEGDVKTSKQKHKGISKKMVDILRQRTCAKFEGSFAIQEKSSQHGGVVSESPKLELCAIVVKDHIFESRNEVEIGGWGLKFLKRRGGLTSRENTSCCSTGMDVLVPAGFHGEPRKKSGGCGPSSLVERWRSGGSCDCGGWDIGCPLTVLQATPNKSSSFDLFVQGYKQSVPILNMVKIHEDLYDIHYKSALSSLQAFSIAVAKIHSQSPTLRPKLHRK